ncbi:MAG: tocopherol cyclase family protein [Halanaerobium sp.]|nr:tocopherol cyclase family protein [Halanaerobium sp.]
MKQILNIFSPDLQFFHPERYQGFGQKPVYFEGWYFKLTPVAGMSLAVIPGIFKGPSLAESYAFIQVLDGRHSRSCFLQFALEEFWSARNDFQVKIGPNYFSPSLLRLNLGCQGMQLKGELSFDGLKPWPVTLASPGAMGCFAYLPFLECRHGILSMDHIISGKLQVCGKTVNFNSGRGYLEKDWGHSFPRTWVWLQCNQFAAKGISLTASIASVPIFNREIKGFIIGLYYQDRLLRFTTYNRARLEQLEIDEERVEFMVSNRDYRLNVRAQAEQFFLLYSSDGEKMVKNVRETLQARVEVSLQDKSGRVLWHDLSQRAGLEINGDIMDLNI